VPLTRGTNGPHKYSPSIDRMNPKLGYVKGNVRVISQLANGMKQHATLEEVEQFCKTIVGYMKGEL